MAAPILCIGDKTYYYPFDNSLRGAKSIQAAPMNAKTIFKVNIPPFVLTYFEEENCVNVSVLSIVDKFLYDEDGMVTSIPWTFILRWLNIGTTDQGKLFLQHLALGTEKKKLQKKPTSAKLKVPLSRLLSTATTFLCTCPRHNFLCDTPANILPKDIDTDHYHLFYKVVCRRCAINLKEWSANGFLRSSHARRALLALERLPAYSHLIDALLMVVNCSKSKINFYRYASISSILTYDGEIELDIKALFTGNISLARVLVGKWQDFSKSFSTRKQFEIGFHGAVAYRLFGQVNFRKESTLISECLSYAVPIKKVASIKPIFCVISVLEKNGLQLVLADPLRRANYIHVGNNLNLPGILSVKIDQVKDYLQQNPDSTVVSWPAHELSAFEFNFLCDLDVPVLLAGTPFVLTDKETYGQPFTKYIQEGGAFSYYGPVTHPMKNFFDTYPASLKIPITHPFFHNDGMIMTCPALDGMYNRFLLTTLYYSSKILISVIPGPLQVVPLATIALLSAHLSNTL